ncbi:MAG TPA: D-alanyl-D-alanine carboxypeptidase/D-alanyl-D-alanine-endopeptidase, partial [Pyrinomonadaceae bacterium]|nr:D-alanyl-D-alanine carboxypeptidase/D-alanyl-D-alanine-endopeptidase [Pyrinomonadaceae bacterium]
MKFHKSGLLIAAVLGVVLTTLFFLSYYPVGLAREDKLTGKSGPPPVRKSETVSTSPSDAALAREIDRVIDESNVKARWGVFVMSPKDGRVLYSRDADKSFTPASNMKVYTTAVALDLLGGDYRWRTSVYARKQADSNGVIDGELVLYGRGAPDLISKPRGDAPSLTKLADQLYQAGVREVRGDVVGDESYFRGELFGMGWQWNDLQWYFGAEPSALSIDENSVEVTMSPAAKKGESANVIVTPNQNFVRLTNNATTGEHDAITTIGIIRGLSDNNVSVWGGFPVGGRAFSAFISVHDPTLWAAILFKQALIGRG